MSNINVRGFVTLSDVNTDKMKDGQSSGVSSKVGGRFDYRQKVDRFNFVVSGTDTSARDYDNLPNIKDAVITADTHHDGEHSHEATLVADDLLDSVWLVMSIFRCHRGPPSARLPSFWAVPECRCRGTTA